MRCWVLICLLACGPSAAPPAPEPAPVQAESVSEQALPTGPSRQDILQRGGVVHPASLQGLDGGWTRVGTHLQERVLKSVCGGGVPRLGVVSGRQEVHAFDGRSMVVLDIIREEKPSAGEWRLWLAPVGQERPVHRVRVQQVDVHTLRWRSEEAHLDWADGADWVRDGQVRGLVRVEPLDCGSRAR